MIIEVLSPSTENVDRGKKLLYYQAHPTIQDYLMVDSQSIRVEVYHREKSRWTLSRYGLQDEVEVENLDIQFRVRDVYRRIGLLKRASTDV